MLQAVKLLPSDQVEVIREWNAGYLPVYEQ